MDIRQRNEWKETVEVPH